MAEQLTGRELDAEVERVVFGGAPTQSSVDGEWYTAPADKPVPYYSLHISAAWLVVERMRELGQEKRFSLHAAVNVERELGYFPQSGSKTFEALFYGPIDVPELICRAALATIQQAAPQAQQEVGT